MPLLPYTEALRLALAAATTLPSETVQLNAACGRVLAAELRAEAPLPSFEHSAMDGYALKHQDLSQAEQQTGRWWLPLRGESRAGHPLSQLQPGHACRIFTGAPLPAGADAVVIQENVERTRGGIASAHMPRLKEHVRPRGRDIQAGQLALDAGSKLGPPQIGLAAALDQSEVTVHRQPRVALLSSGDELRAPGSPKRPGSVVDSNRIALRLMLQKHGAAIGMDARLPDDRQATCEAFVAANKTSDLILTIGGASVGDHDLIRPCLTELGAEILFWGVRIKPGKPVGLSTLQSPEASSLVLALPGNPASAMLGFLLFAIPLLQKFQGLNACQPKRILLPVLGSHHRRPGREEYLRARLVVHDGRLAAQLPDNHASGSVLSFAKADALVCMAPDRSAHTSGDELPVILLSEFD
jgi:molybdopterin molybdotransferase